MSKFPIICGIIGKKLYLTILLALVLILYNIFTRLIPEGNSIPLTLWPRQGKESLHLHLHNLSAAAPALVEAKGLMNNLGGPVIEMLSVFIPCIFKLKDKSKTSSKKCTKSNFKDYFILFLITILFIGINYFIEYLDINAIKNKIN